VKKIIAIINGKKHTICRSSKSHPNQDLHNIFKEIDKRGYLVEDAIKVVLFERGKKPKVFWYQYTGQSEYICSYKFNPDNAVCWVYNKSGYTYKYNKEKMVYSVYKDEVFLYNCRRNCGVNGKIWYV